MPDSFCAARFAVRPTPRLLRRRCAATLILVCLACVALAQRHVRAQAQAEDKPKLPPKEDVTLLTEDEMVIKASYWPSRLGKEAVPVILLHMFGGSRQDYNLLAEALQRKGCAVIAPDLRGHGDSTQMHDSPRLIHAAEMSPAAFSGMLEDVEAVKKFLMGKNNAGALNIDKLCLVGAEMGAAVAANWAVTDWNWPPLAIGKQGQDVKAMVLLSPPERFKSLRMLEPLNDRAVRSRIAVYLACGNDDPIAVREMARIYTTLKRFHPETNREEDRDLFINRDVQTRLQGTKLLAKEFDVSEQICEFIELRAAHQPIVWQDRKLP